MSLEEADSLLAHRVDGWLVGLSASLKRFGSSFQQTLESRAFRCGHPIGS